MTPNPSTASRTAWRSVVEDPANFGVAPTSGWAEHNVDSDNFTVQTRTRRSDALRSDSQTTNIRTPSLTGGGPLEGEFRYSEWDNWWVALIQAAGWTSAATTADTDLSAVAAAGTVPAYFEKAAGDLTTTWQAGDWLYSEGWTTTGTGNNGIYRKVVHVTTSRVYVQGGAIAAKAAGDSVTLTRIAQLTNGVTVTTFSHERKDTNAGEYHLFTGCSLPSATLEAPRQDLLKWSYNWFGKKPISNTSQTHTPGNPSAAPTGEPLMSSEIRAFWEGDTELGNITTSQLLWDVTPFKMVGGTFTWENGQEPRTGWGTTDVILAPGQGEVVGRGTLRMHYSAGTGGTPRDAKALYDKIANETVSAIALLVTDPDNDTNILEFARVKFTGGRRSTRGGKGTDTILEMEFEAFRNPNDNNREANVDGTTSRFCRHAA